MQSQTKRYGKPYYQTQQIQNSQFVNSVVPSESTISLNAPYGIENFDNLLGTEEYADQAINSLKKQDIYQTAAVDYQEVYNNDGQYINLQRRKLMPDLTVSQSQIMEQANRLNQSNIQTRDQRRFKTGNNITQSTAVQNIMQRAGETGQLLPTITPFDGVQQDPMGYDALAIQANIPQDRMTVQEVVQQPVQPMQENYVRMARYKNRSMDPEERMKQQYRRLYGKKSNKARANGKENFEYMDSEQSSQNQNFDTSGQIADLLNMFSDYKVKLTPAMQASLISILGALVENPASFSEIRKSREYQAMPMMYKFNIFRASLIVKDGMSASL